MSVIVDGVRFPESRSNPGAPWQGWPVRKSPPHIIVAGNDNSPKRYRGGYPALAWLANRNPEGAAAIWSLRSTIEPVYLDKGGIDDDHSWDGDGIGDADVRHRIHPRIEDLLAACADRHAITPRGRHADRTGPLRDGLPAADKQYRIAEKWYRLGRAVFNADAADDQDGLLRFWLDKGGRVQFPRVQRVPRSGSKLPVHWRTLRYLSAWFGHRRAPTPCQELEALYASECRDFHLRRRGTPLPPTVYQPTGFARVDIPHEKAELRAQLAAAMAGHPVTILPAGAAKTADRHAGNKEGLAIAEIWREADEAPPLPDPVAVTVEAILARATLSDVAAAHGTGTETTRPDRLGRRLVTAAAAAVLSALAANDNKICLPAAA